MPKLDGFEATRQLNAGDNAAWVLMLSIRTDEKDVQAAADSGTKGYLVKNCSRDELIRAIRMVHQNQLAICPEVARFFPAEPGNT